MCCVKVTKCGIIEVFKRHLCCLNIPPKYRVLGVFALQEKNMANVITPIIMIVLLCALYVKLGNKYLGTTKKHEECVDCGNQYELGFLINSQCEMCKDYSHITSTNQWTYRAFQVRGYPFCLTCGVRKDKQIIPLSTESTMQAYPDGFTCCSCENVYTPPARSNS